MSVFEGQSEIQIREELLQVCIGKQDAARKALAEADEWTTAARHELEKAKIKAAPPVDRAACVLADGSPITQDHREFKENGQQKAYVVLTAEERAKGFVRPVRRTYLHLRCDTTTTMGQSIAETYARDPYFYSGTFCVGCGKHFPVGDDGEFVWLDEKSQKVGT